MCAPASPASPWTPQRATCSPQPGWARPSCTAPVTESALSTHEEPYIIEGNRTVVEAGFAFSVEPGFYLPGKFGARIEDIVVATADGVASCNNQTHELVIVEG